MPFDTPTLAKLVARAASDLAGVDGLRHSDAQVAARVQAGGHFGLYGHQEWIARQILPDTSDEAMLLRQGRLRPMRDRLPAVAAKGSASFVGNAGALLDAGTLVQRNDGVQFRVVDAVPGNAGAVQLEAVTAGVLGNTPAGTKLSLVSPVLGIVDGFTVTGDAGLSGGVELESIEDYRVRVIRSYRVLPHGGNKDDYETWALEVPGVTRAWTKRHWLGPGTVGVFVMRDADPNPIPNAQALAEVKAYIESQRPVTAELYVMAPTPKPVVYQIADLVPDSSALRAAVAAALEELHYREAEPGVTMLLTHMGEAISTTAGERDHRLLYPTENMTAAGNELLTFGGVQWP